ncbi:GntR family transcriptional regulator [bacterium]|nr:MAG: GntR family transcriptional regulator [bacterium]
MGKLVVQADRMENEENPTGLRFGAPAYERIAQDLRNRVSSGELTEGRMLPGRRALAVEYKVSLPTIERAVANLVSDGVLRTDLRRGTFVGQVAKTSSTTPQKIAALGIMAPLRIPATAHDMTHNGTYAMVGAFERAISRSGNRTTFFNLWRDAPEGEDRLSAAEGYEALVAQGVSVVVAANALRQADMGPIRRIAASGGVPLVIVNEEKVSPPLFVVHYDHADAAHQAANHLLDGGCRSLLYFSARVSSWGEQRWEGVRRAVSEAGLPRENVLDATNREAVETDAPIHDATQGGLAHARRLFAGNANLLAGGGVGVIAANDQMAWGFIEAAAERGMKMARDYLIVGFDDMPESRDLGLTSMRPPLENLGEEAATLALQAIQGPSSARRISLHSELVARNSSRFVMPVLVGTR